MYFRAYYVSRHHLSWEHHWNDGKHASNLALLSNFCSKLWLFIETNRKTCSRFIIFFEKNIHPWLLSILSLLVYCFTQEITNETWDTQQMMMKETEKQNIIFLACIFFTVFLLLLLEKMSSGSSSFYILISVGRDKRTTTSYQGIITESSQHTPKTVTNISRHDALHDTSTTSKERNMTRECKRREQQQYP